MGKMSKNEKSFFGNRAKYNFAEQSCVDQEDATNIYKKFHWNRWLIVMVDYWKYVNLFMLLVQLVFDLPEWIPAVAVRHDWIVVGKMWHVALVVCFRHVPTKAVSLARRTDVGVSGRVEETIECCNCQLEKDQIVLLYTIYHVNIHHGLSHYRQIEQEIYLLKRNIACRKKHLQCIMHIMYSRIFLLPVFYCWMFRATRNGIPLISHCALAIYFNSTLPYVNLLYH